MTTTFVLATDGLLYADPVLSGDGWFLCFSADEPPELVVRGTDRAEAVAFAQDKIAELGITAVVDGNPRRAVRTFRDEGRLVRAEAFGFYLEVLAPVPWERIPRDYLGTPQPHGEAVVYNFDRPWG